MSVHTHTHTHKMDVAKETTTNQMVNLTRRMHRTEEHQKMSRRLRTRLSHCSSLIETATNANEMAAPYPDEGVTNVILDNGSYGVRFDDALKLLTPDGFTDKTDGYGNHVSHHILGTTTGKEVLGSLFFEESITTEVAGVPYKRWGAPQVSLPSLIQLAHMSMNETNGHMVTTPVRTRLPRKKKKKKNNK